MSIDNEIGAFAPLRSAPEESFEGQNGLINHLVLNDKRHVMTADTAGNIVMWDILQCIPVRSFGKKPIDEVFKAVNPSDTIPQWCEIDTRTGALACTLDVAHCFAAEVYADEQEEFQGIDVKEDQRISLGAWALRYLFANFVDEELKRDDSFRRQFGTKTQGTGEKDAETSLASLLGGGDGALDNPSKSSDTPGLRIGLATPKLNATMMDDDLPGTGSASPIRKSGDDYFSSQNARSSDTESQDDALKTPKPDTAPGPGEPVTAASPTKEAGKSFGKRLRGTFTPKKGKNPAVVDESAVLQTDDKVLEKDPASGEISKETGGKIETTADLIAEIRTDYIRMRSTPTAGPQRSLLTPALPTEAPVLKPPRNTAIAIQVGASPC